MTGEKVLTRRRMVELREQARLNGATVVFTNGCFDILHIGHVNYLHEARELGDFLLVGVNSDSSAHGLKGPVRPFNAQLDRAGVLAALEDVSAVSIFDEPTASELVEAVRPDIYVKGGDYSEDPGSPAFPVEGHIVAAYGGEVTVIPFAPGYSTTALVEKIRKSGQAGFDA